MDHLQEAKRVLVFDGSESKKEVAACAQLAQARALIALVERLDKLIFKDPEHPALDAGLGPNKY